MCDNLVCQVCRGQGVLQREHNSYSVTLCNEHFNELHCKLQERKPRKALLKFHDARLSYNDKDGLNAWMDAGHEYFLVTDKIVKGMMKAHKKKRKKTPRPKPADEGKIIQGGQ